MKHEQTKEGKGYENAASIYVCLVNVLDVRTRINKCSVECQETTFGSRNTIKLVESAGVLPIAETNTIMAGASSEVKNNAKYD